MTGENDRTGAHFISHCEERSDEAISGSGKSEIAPQSGMQNRTSPDSRQTKAANRRARNDWWALLLRFRLRTSCFYGQAFHSLALTCTPQSHNICTKNDNTLNT